MSKNLILSLDPSKNATGYVIYNLDKMSIVETGVFDARTSKTFKRKTEKHQEECRNFSKFLEEIFLKYGFHTIVSEYPHGTQSANASRSLSMVNSVISTFADFFGCELITYLERDAKKNHFGRIKVKKLETIKAMNETFSDFVPPTKNGKPIKYKQEAISDALLILKTYLDNANIHISS